MISGVEGGAIHDAVGDEESFDAPAGLASFVPLSTANTNDSEHRKRVSRCMSYLLGGGLI
jgi:hypothetical protein